MRILSYVLLFALSEARNSVVRKDYDDDNPSPLQKKVDVYPQNFAEPVPFGHITLEGFGDPFSSVKQPIDALELSMRAPKNRQEAKEMLKLGRKHISFINTDLAKKYSSPRDEYLNEMMVNPPPETNTTKLKWYDMVAIQTRNAMLPPAGNPRRTGGRSAASNVARPLPPVPVSVAKRPFFGKGSFELSRHRPEPQINWTTCDQLAVGAIFSPKDIVDLKWTPFYIWSARSNLAYATVHTFEYPTKKVVNEYHSKYNKFLNKTVDWSRSKLLMKGMNEMLLIAADKKGLFDAIARHEIPESAKYNPITLPSLSIRFKIEDPYLLMSYCEDYYATLMAISGKEPTLYKDIKAEVATINFIGTGRAVWRDFEGEKEKIRLEQEARIQEERDKVIVIDESIPPVGQWD